MGTVNLSTLSFCATALIATSSEDSDMASLQQQRQEQNYFIRLGSLSERLRNHAYEHSLGKLRNARQSAHEAMQQLMHALSLVSFGVWPGLGSPSCSSHPSRAGISLGGLDWFPWGGFLHTMVCESAQNM